MRSALLLAAITGCATLSGLDGKTADLEDQTDAPDRDARAPDGATPASDGPLPSADGGTPPVNDGSSGDTDAPASGTRIRNITFENAALVHPTSGWDSIFGGAQLLANGPLAGAYSMQVEGTAQYGTISFSAVSNLYLTMKLRVAPADSSTTGDTEFLRITSTGAAPIEALVKGGARDLVVFQGAKTLGTFPSLLTDGTVYRLEMRLLASGRVTLRLLAGGSSALVTSDATVGTFTKVEVGTLGGGTFRAAFDDISLDSAVQP